MVRGCRRTVPMVPGPPQARDWWRSGFVGTQEIGLCLEYRREAGFSQGGTSF
jgi:hypothetical protein